MATTIKLRGPVDLDELHQVCAQASRPQSRLGLMAASWCCCSLATRPRAVPELLADWLQAAGVEVMQVVG